MVHEFTNVDDFRAAFTEEATKGTKFLAWFTGAIDANGRSWCGDCVNAKDDIERIVGLAEGKRTVLKGVVTRAEWSGQSGHPYRHAPFNAGGVPCMVLFEGA